MTFILAWLLADLLSGIGHYIQDKMMTGPYKLKFLNEVDRDNKNHHSKPGSILKYSYLENLVNTLYITVPFIVLSFVFTGISVITLAFFFLSFVNIIHRWAHTPKKKLNTIIRFFQSIGIFQSQEHHNAHHYLNKKVVKKEDATKNYCIMTNFLNPIINLMLR